MRISPEAVAEWDARCAAIRANPRAVDVAWRAGQLWWKCHYPQWLMYQQFYSSTVDEEVWDIARRFGKTVLEFVLCCEASIRKAGAEVKFATQTQKDARKILRGVFPLVLQDCPADMRPKWSTQTMEIVWPNGSIIDIAGCDAGHYEHLRGQRADLWIVDEAGFIDELEMIVDSVLGPQTWHSGGRGIIASTPPPTPGHHFQQRYLGAKLNGASAHFTFWDNPTLSLERKTEIVEKAARKKRMTLEEFKRTTHYRREFLAEFVADASRAVFPVLTEELSERLIRDVDAVPLFADSYLIGDLGGTRDPTAVLAASWDFYRAKWIIWGGEVLHRPSTEQIANATHALARKYLPEADPEGAQRFHIMDDPMGIVSRDLALKHGLPFFPPDKDDKQAAAMAVNDMLAHEEVEFHEDARDVVTQCQAAIWNKTHREFERVDGFGHFEFADCLIYGARNVIKNKGRVPRDWGFNSTTMHRRTKPDDDLAALRRAFGG